VSGYLDAASAVPLHPAARAALERALAEGWTDPARLYGAARRVRIRLDEARATVARALGAEPEEVSFTASGTQANHLAVLGAAAGRWRAGRRIVAGAVEHSSVLAAADRLANDPAVAVDLIGVDHTGRVDVEAFRAALGPDTALACLQTANHEVGTLQPVEEISPGCAAAGVPLLIDAAQSVGRVPVDVDRLGAGLLTASAHKWGGPPGVGILVVRRGVRWRSPLPSDERENGRVPGAENVPAILAAAAALDARLGEMEAEGTRLRRLVDRIRGTVLDRIPDVEILGDPVRRLPHLVTFSCLYVEGEALLGELDRAGFAVSSGSSCTAATRSPSHVLEAMGALTHGNIRVSLHAGTDDADVDRFLDLLPVAVARLRRIAGADRL